MAMTSLFGALKGMFGFWIAMPSAGHHHGSSHGSKTSISTEISPIEGRIQTL
jgi:hypothetical protein